MKVSVIMITYNQSKFISDAILGVLNQKTTFDYELILSNDNSTDNTDKVIRNFLEKVENSDRVKYFNQTKNLGMQENFLFCFSKATGDYIAICEGDDYWTNSNKLQEQVNYLDSSIETSLICSDYDVMVVDSNRLEGSVLKSKYSVDMDFNIYDYLRNRDIVRTFTVMYRRKDYDDYLQEVARDIVVSKSAGDVPSYIYLLNKGKGHYFSQVAGVYRKTSNSASRIVDLDRRFQFKRGVYKIILYFVLQYKLDKERLKPTIIDGIVTDMEYYLYKGKYLHIFISLFKIILMGGRSKRALEIVNSIFDSKKKQEILTQI